MSSNRKYSIVIRVACGLLGITSLWATLSNYINADEFVLEYKLVSIVIVTFIFLYVAVVGTSPIKGLNGGR